MDFLCWFLVFITLITAIMLCPADAVTRVTEKREVLDSKKNGGVEKRRKKHKRVDFDANSVEGMAGKVRQLEGSDKKDDAVQLFDDVSEKVGFLDEGATGASAPESLESQNVGLRVKDVVGGMDDSRAVRECGDAVAGENQAVHRGVEELFERPSVRTDQESAGGRVELEREVTNCVDSYSDIDNAAAAPGSSSTDNKGGNDVIDDDEEWEGVESSELQKVFAEAVNYVEYVWKGKDSDLQMLFYGLHKLAVEGPCHTPQPMALMITARAKWNAWNRLGSMSPEDAMGEYIKVLSDADPGWKQHFTAESNSHGSLQTAEDGHIAS